MLCYGPKIISLESQKERKKINIGEEKSEETILRMSQKLKKKKSSKDSVLKDLRRCQKINGKSPQWETL